MALQTLIFGLMILVGAAGIGSRFIPGFKTDNPIEEVAEEILEKKTGISKIDLSPDTPDPDDDKQEVEDAE